MSVLVFVIRSKTESMLLSLTIPNRPFFKECYGDKMNFSKSPAEFFRPCAQETHVMFFSFVFVLNAI